MSVKVDIVFRNMDQVMKAIEKETKGVADALAFALYEEGSNILTKSQRYVPVKYGLLRSSAWARLDGERTNTPSVTLAYGVSYASFVHERADVHHKRGQAKFLERAFNEAVGSGWSTRLARRVNYHWNVGTKQIGKLWPTSNPVSPAQEAARQERYTAEVRTKRNEAREKVRQREANKAARATQRKLDSAARAAQRKKDREALAKIRKLNRAGTKGTKKFVNSIKKKRKKR